MARVITQIADPPPGSFEFTPEGYAKASFWVPEDGFSRTDFTNQSFGSYEEYEAQRGEFEIQVSGKIEIVEGNGYWKGSLRDIFPDRWLVAYTPDESWRETNGKKESFSIYHLLKNKFLFKSVVLGYGEGPIHEAIPSDPVAMYIKEHCASSARLKAISLRAYDSLTNVRGYTTWTSVSPPIFLCLAAAKSSMDAMSAVLWALLFRETPTEKKIPSMRTLYDKLKSKTGTPFVSVKPGTVG